MMDMIRQVRKEDLYAIVEIEAICFQAAEAADKETITSRIDTFPESFFVAEKDGRIVGFINGAVTNERTIRDEMFENAGLHISDGTYQSIFGLDVIPEYQHQGIAGRLMRHLINNAMIKGRKGLILTCKEHLIGFYEQFGFSSLGLSESVHGGAVWYDMIMYI
ncbi:GNAT family N-acetyltransferase [Vallitalea maricola]|uniref:GNAT family N-acetyltransferase n=1 Tax=Vallitalea maricola TaxID=3074433 RepID=A0ACB5UMM8_9FIRM|nr:GNAT family N-acetyltransferase [Vallitalea sp. AN17-2]